MIEHKTINGISLLCETFDPKRDDIHAAYLPGASVEEIGQAEAADVTLNFNYADTDEGLPIGRLIVDGVEVVHDIPKTVARDELYMLPDKTLHIGKAPANAVWAVQGSPPLLKDGAALKGGIERDQLGEDIWSREAYRTAVGITAGGHLVIVRTLDEVYLSQLTTAMLELGCMDALNGDGGGSSYMWPEDNGWGRKLGSALVIKRGEPKMRRFKRYTPEDYIEQVLKPMVNQVKFSEVHVHGTWEPTIVDFKAATDKEKVIWGMWNYHVNTRGWDDIGQHATIDPDGYIWDGRSLKKPPASATGYNDPDDDRIHPFMYEMIGNFDKDHEKLEGKQLAATVILTNAVVKLWGAAVKFHREMTNQKTCPGSGIEKGWFMEQLNSEEALPTISRKVGGRLNGEPVPEDGYLIDGRSYVPVRCIAEAVGAEVGWDGDKFEYTLKTKG